MAIPFYWAGLLVTISFLEAPLKVQVPGITLQLGLGISQLKFTALIDRMGTGQGPYWDTSGR